MIQTSLRLIGLLAAAWLMTGAPQADAARSPESTTSRRAAGFTHAYAIGDCAPWDGAAVRIVIQATPVVQASADARPVASYPAFSAALFIRTPPIGRWIALPGLGEGGGHLSEASAVNKHQSRTGRILITQRTKDRIVGELRVHLTEDGSREIVFPFSAPVLKVQVMCG